MLLRIELGLSILIGSGGGMTAWLLSWNPKNWEWDTFFRERAITASGRPVENTWSCANGAVAKGDTVYCDPDQDEFMSIRTLEDHIDREQT